MPAYKDEQRKTWYAKFNYKDWTGQTKTKLKRGFRTKREALEFEAEFKRMNSGVNTEMTMSTLFNCYLEDSKGRVKPSTYVSRENVIDHTLRPFFGSMLASEVKPITVRQWQNQQLERGVAKGTVFAWHSVLSSSFNYGIKFRGLHDNPARVCGNVNRPSKSMPKFWTKEQFNKFLEAVPRREYRFLFETLFYSGMRIGELLALKYDDVDMDARTIHVQGTYSELPGRTIIQAPKSECSNRIITMPEFWMQDLKEYMEWFYELSEDGRIFFWAKHAASVRDYFTRAQEQTDLPKITTHDLRDSHASLLIEMGMPVLLIAERLGHSDPSITLKIYSHLYPNKHQELADKLDEIEGVSYVYHGPKNENKIG